MLNATPLKSQWEEEWIYTGKPDQAAQLFIDGLFTFAEMLEVFEKEIGPITRDHEEIWERYRVQCKGYGYEMPYTILLELVYGDQEEFLLELLCS